MIRAAMPVSRVEWAVLALLVVTLATLATMILGGPGGSLSFDLTQDPAAGLWNW